MPMYITFVIGASEYEDGDFSLVGRRTEQRKYHTQGGQEKTLFGRRIK
jgi:hypothetical protein